MANSKISALTSAATPLAGTETLPVIQSGATKQVSVANLTAGRTVAGGAYTIGSNQHLLYDIDASTIGIRIGTGGPFYSIRTTGSSNLQLNNASGGDLLLAIAGTTYLTVANTTGNVTLSTGNLIQGTAAKGINFTANTPAAGMTSQLLNWYEDGTWTPSLGGNATYTRQQGYYTRIGRQVTVNCDLIVNVIGTGSTTTISGLPFSSLVPSPGSVGYFSNLNGTYVFIAPMSSGSTIVFETMAAAASDATDTTAIFKSGTRVLFTLSYFV